MLTGPAMVAASLPPPVIVITDMPPLEIVLPPRLVDSFDSQNPLYPPPRRPVDLIDTRYRPDIKLDDLK